MQQLSRINLEDFVKSILNLNEFRLTIIEIKNAENFFLANFTD